MVSKMKNRLALLSTLLVAGLLMAGVGTALGAGNLLKFAGKEVSAVAMNDQLKIYEDGKLVKEVTLPEGEYVWESSGHRLVLHKMTSEEMKKKIVEHQEKLDKWLEIANKDSRVQELTNGEGIQYKEGEYILRYSLTTGEGKLVPVGEPADTAILAFEANGKIYEVRIDLNSETVTSVEERSSNMRSYCYGPEGPIDCSKLPLHGPHAPR